MEITIEITDEALYGREVISVDTSQLGVESQEACSGFLEIAKTNDQSLPYFGVMAFDEFE